MSAPAEHQVFLSLGSNIEPERHLPRAVQLLGWAVRIERVSGAWQSPDVGAAGPDYVNLAVQVGTPLQAVWLKNRLLRPIESRLGRVRSADKFAPRTIDLDILIVDGQILDEGIWSLAYLAIPLAELIPGYTHPASNQTLAQIAECLRRSTHIHPRQDISRRIAAISQDSRIT